MMQIECLLKTHFLHQSLIVKSQQYRIELVTRTGFVQVVIWKRVMEINEELASAVINRSVAIVCLSVGLLCHPGVLNYPTYIPFQQKLFTKSFCFLFTFLLQLFPKL